MSVTDLAATETCAALTAAAEKVEVRPIRYELRKRAKEWRHVCALMDGTDEAEVECVIELAGNVGPGMEVLMAGGVYWSVVRVMRRDGQVSLHLEHEDEPMPRYINLFGPSSPVVVRA